MFKEVRDNKDGDLLIKYIQDGTIGKDETDDKGVCALTHAIDSELKGDVIETLVRLGCDIDCQDNTGQTPLHYALMLDHYSAFEILLKAGADPHITDED